MANEALMTYQQVIESLQKKKRQKHLLGTIQNFV